MSQSPSKNFLETLTEISQRIRRLGALHVVLWVGYSFLFFFGPGLFFDAQTAFIFTLRTLLFNAIIFYINTLVLLPLLLERNRYLAYSVSVLFLIITTSVLWSTTSSPYERGGIENHSNQKEISLQGPSTNEKSKDQIPPSFRLNPATDSYFMAPDPRNKIFTRQLIFGITSSFGILFISTLFWVIVESRRKEKKKLSQSNEVLEMEMRFLKSQINPHFLFNALNNIYFHAESSSPKTSLLVLKLSSMLRFLLYQSDEKKIALNKEIDYIENYIEFQKIKLEETPQLKTDFSQTAPGLWIEPMLLFPFVENAFKHGNIDDSKKGWMQITLKTQGHKLMFWVVNSKPEGPVSKDTSRGIGIENVRKRLSFLYADRHLLQINENPAKFEVYLEIDT